MANYASKFQPPSLDASDFMSIGDRIGGKKIDNAIEKARYGGIPQQGEQTGGYAETYANLAHIPLFPLYSQAQLMALEHIQKRKEKKLSYVPPPIKQTGMEKGAMMIATHLGGGVNPLSMKKWENRLAGVGAVQMQQSMEQTHSIVFTRWMIPNIADIWFVDVLEWRGKSEKAGAQIYVKSGKQASLRILGKDIKELKANKTWTKRWMSFDYCEAVSCMREDKSEVPMVIIARIQRPSAGVEARTSLKDFDKKWIVPLVQNPATGFNSAGN